MGPDFYQCSTRAHRCQFQMQLHLPLTLTCATPNTLIHAHTRHTAPTNTHPNDHHSVAPGSIWVAWPPWPLPLPGSHRRRAHLTFRMRTVRGIHVVLDYCHPDVFVL